MTTTQNIKTIGVIGAGAMGRGIVQLFAQSGYDILLHDTQRAAMDAAYASISETFNTLAGKGRITESQRDANLARISLVDNIQGLAGCQLVIEAIIERLDIKQQLFKALEAVTPADCILASNTSSLSIAAIASACAKPERVAGLHFFNPVPLMKVVEVIHGPRTLGSIIDELCKLTESAGHKAVVANDMPGFIVNHSGRGFGTESLKLLAEGVSDIPETDAILKEQVVLGTSGSGFKLGPFELMDLTGLDVSHPVMESIYTQFYEEPRYRPSALAAQRYAAGLFGRKTGAGFYRYADKQQVFDGARLAWPAPAPANQIAGLKVALTPTACGQSADSAAKSSANPVPLTLTELIGGLGATLVDSRDEADLLVDTPLGLDLTQSLKMQGLIRFAGKSVALDTLFPFGLKACKRRVLMSNPASSVQTLSFALALFAADGAKVSMIKDSPGFVAQRVIAMIIAIACDMAQLGVASPEDINEAVRLGLGYPLGPLAMGDALGPQKVLDLLCNLHAATEDPRYRPAAWLKRRAALNLGLTHPD